MNIKIILIIILIAIVGTGGYFLMKYIWPTPATPQNGFLQGKINIGPLCPVERIPPDPRCQPTLETYAAWPIAVYSSNQEIKISDIKPDAAGSYKVELPTGTYIVNFERQTPFARSLPETVIGKKKETTIFNIDIDTGIR